MSFRRENSFFEQLLFLRGHRIIHLGLKMISRHREVPKVIRRRRVYRSHKYRDGGLTWRYDWNPQFQNRVQWRSRCPINQRGKVNKIKYPLR